MQRWLGMSFGVTYGEDHMEFYALVNELIEDWMIPMEPSATQAVDPRNAPRSDAIATRGPRLLHCVERVQTAIYIPCSMYTPVYGAQYIYIFSASKGCPKGV